MLGPDGYSSSILSISPSPPVFQGQDLIAWSPRNQADMMAGPVERMVPLAIEQPRESLVTREGLATDQEKGSLLSRVGDVIEKVATVGVATAASATGGLVGNEVGTVIAAGVSEMIGDPSGGYVTEAVGRKLGLYLRRRKRVKQEGERRNVFLRYLGEVATAVSDINGANRQ